MGCELFQNVREGPWLLDYLSSRLEGYPNLCLIKTYLRNSSDQIKNLPQGLRPKYFSKVLLQVFSKATEAILTQMTGIGQSPDPFIHQLTLAAVQMYG